MTTKSEKIAELKLLHPTLRKGSEEEGYTDLTSNEYEKTIEEWAKNQLEEAAKAAESESIEKAKLDAIDKLTALGIDPKALGL